MLVPFSWLRELVTLPTSISAREVAEAITRRGLEVESVVDLGRDITGPLVVGRVLTIEELTEFKKPIRWVSLNIGNEEPQWVVCGASNFAVGDLVVVAVPGAVLPGNFAISARETYGKTSNGMICSARELGLSEDHSGIIVLPEGSAKEGADALSLLHLDDSVIDVAVTPDRGYALSMRGIAREVAIAFDLDFIDPVVNIKLTPATGGPREVKIGDAHAADRIVVRTVDGFNPAARTPLWMQRRLEMSGMRSISLLVDITNYVMLELGQPLHAFDDAKLQGPIEVRAAHQGEVLETLDHVKRDLTPHDAVISDGNRALALAGIMGGLETEIDSNSSRTTIEAAHFNSIRIAKSARHHKLSSEASRRFERGVDNALPDAASQRAVQLLTEIAGGNYVGGNEVDARAEVDPIDFDFSLPTRLVGFDYSKDVIAKRLIQVGCQISGSKVTPPSWRPDLTIPEDLVEEVARLEGYDQIPSVLPISPGGRGLSQRQKLRRRSAMVLAARGGVEVLCYPFVGESFYIETGLSSSQAVKLANPISEQEPFLRTTLISGLVAAAQRNISRGSRSFSIFEVGSVFLRDAKAKSAPRLGTERRPSDEELAQLLAAIPEQPLHVAGLAVGEASESGWWGTGQKVDWRSAVSDVESVLVGYEYERRSAEKAPWHPGRCAEFFVDGVSVGFAGELHPRLLASWGLPAHSAAFEINLDALEARSIIADPVVTMVPAIEDIALVVAATTPAEQVRTLILSASPLIESAQLFDRYDQLGDGKVSLAFTLTMRAADRTLTGEELAEIRAQVLVAVGAVGATLR